MPATSHAYDLPSLAVVCDTETVTLDPVAGSVWEVAMMRLSDRETIYLQVFPDMNAAVDIALEIGGFHDRFDPDTAFESFSDRLRENLAEFLPDKAVLVGSNPGFDIAHLDAMWATGTDKWGRSPWHYHGLDVSSMAVAYLGMDSDLVTGTGLANIAEAVGIDPNDFATHTAMGDVELTVAALEMMCLI